MQALISPAGEAALADLLAQRPLLAFDFDGTLAPIVEHPRDARIPEPLVTRLRELTRMHPVAVVSGRAAGDVRSRLGFVPQYVIGNHGAEDDAPGAPPAAMPTPVPDAGGPGSRGPLSHFAAELAPLRATLAHHAAELAAAAVLVEDKHASLALHYRRAPEPERALALVTRLLAPPAGAPWRLFGGKMVVNVVAADAPDKADAVRTLVARAGAGTALFVGDDINDEPVFAAAPPHWLTVRVGREGATDFPTRARFLLDGPEQMVWLLDRLLGARP